LATASKNLYKQLLFHVEKKKLETQILKDITRTIATIKPLISWLDRAPFQGKIDFGQVIYNT
jgi:connector enhancer of kinase suppressor of Ras 2